MKKIGIKQTSNRLLNDTRNLLITAKHPAARQCSSGCAIKRFINRLEVMEETPNKPQLENLYWLQSSK